MKYYFLFITFLLGFGKFATAQTVTATGTVKDNTGNFLHYAFVQDKQDKNGTYTDSLGNFSLATRPNALIIVTCGGYAGTSVTFNGKDALDISLQPAGSSSVGGDNSNAAPDNSASGVQNNLRDQLSLSPTVPPVTMQQGSVMAIIHTKDATQGSRTFFKDWAHGYIVNSGDSLVQYPGFLLNYDKVHGDLILTKDKKSAISIYKEKVKTFTIFDELNQPYTFTVVPEIDKKHYVMVIAGGANYKIYKSITTKFVESNYSSDGIASTGNNYDEYVDENSYYVVVKGGAPQKISLRKKALKDVFSADPQKLTQFMKDNDGDIDDTYLRDLGDYMNK